MPCACAARGMQRTFAGCHLPRAQETSRGTRQMTSGVPFACRPRETLSRATRHETKLRYLPSAAYSTFTNGSQQRAVYGRLPSAACKRQTADRSKTPLGRVTSAGWPFSAPQSPRSPRSGRRVRCATTPLEGPPPSSPRRRASAAHVLLAGSRSKLARQLVHTHTGARAVWKKWTTFPRWRSATPAAR